MQSKISFKNVLVALGLVAVSFVSQASASEVTGVNYMMGTVTLSTSTDIISVIGTNTATTCVKFITSFHKQGDRGAEVVKLQKFLNEKNGANLNEKGFFGPVTEQEVKNFQFTYGIEVTGAQLAKTTEVINKLNCSLIEKKDRKVYSKTENLGVVATSSVSVIKNIDSIKIYPNAEKTGVRTVEKVPEKNIEKSPVVTSTTSPSFMDSIKQDINKIKENYKAYLLVFALVLALFWFLRKAATE